MSQKPAFQPKAWEIIEDNDQFFNVHAQRTKDGDLGEIIATLSAKSEAELFIVIPDLYAALKAALPYIPHDAPGANDVLHPVLSQARAIIAKVERLVPIADPLPTPACVAREFRNVLRSWLSDEEWKEVRRRNAERGPDDHSCASHDFCDANMAMDAALRNIQPELGAPLDGEWVDQRPEIVDLWNTAWDLAKRDYLTARPKSGPRP